jgi:hypothetical protein
VSAAAWPNLFVVGAAKAGTTSLWRYLDDHPDVFMSPVKEPHFFAPSETTVFRKVDEEDAYLRLFADGASARYRGEASPSYLWERGAPAEIRRRSLDARILVALREPVSRAHSRYLHAARATERRTFLEAVRDELAEPPGDAPSLYVGRSRYADDVERYLETFGDRVHVLFFEELTADPAAELRRVFAFLELDPEPADRLEAERHNELSRPRNALVKRLLGSSRARSVGRALVPLAVQPRVERLLLVPTARPEIEPEARELLVEHYAADVERLERLLGRPAPWERATAAAQAR